MTFRQRLPYFLVGLFIGIIAVIFIWGKKNTTFDYGPNARVLKNIRSKELIINPAIKEVMMINSIDSLTIKEILNKGNADMWNKVKTDSCIRYEIKGKKHLDHISITISNCKTEAILEKITIDH